MFVSVEEAIQAIADGQIIILTDDESRENEGDLVCAGIHADPQAVNFMITQARGLLCAVVGPQVAERLALRQPAGNHDPRGTAFTQSIDAIAGNTTGVSAFDRANTIATMVRPDSAPGDFYSPGHLFPLIARQGGVLERDGHTEGIYDLVRLAGLPPVGVLCEKVKEDGTMARMADLEAFSREYRLKMCSVAAIIEYRRRTGK